ncbi:MAG: four helix bundle protein [Saprospiraceae bacterium]|nr:four helix bundle protein [Saprospiraceae bacterium]
MRDFRKLEVWQDAMNLVQQVYRITGEFPAVEKYGLAQQLQRSAVSIPSNIAEGCGRSSDNVFSHYLDLANGSAFELETQLLLSAQLNYAAEQHIQPLIEATQSIQRRLYALRRKL